MMKQPVERASFAAGEVSPRLRARTDLARQQIAVARAENFVVLLEGGLTRTPGTRFILPQRNEAQRGKLIPFHFSANDAYMIVANGGYLRFFRNEDVIISGGDPYEIAAPWTEADLANLRWAQAGNLVFFAARGKKPRVLTRSGHTSWSLADYLPEGGPIDTPNLDPGLTIQASAATGSVTLTANTARWVADDVGTIWRLDEPDLSAVPIWKGNEDVTAGALRRNNGNVYEAANTASSGPNAPTHAEGTVSSGGGNVSWIFRHPGYGYVRITAVSSPPSTTATATVLTRLPASVVSGPTYRWWPPAWSDARGWPEIVRLHDGRLFWARGDKWWLTEPNDFFSFAITPDNEASAIAARLTSPDGSLISIRWALSSGLLALGTAASEWSIRGNTSYDALTINNARPLVEGGEGSAEHLPALVDAGALFIGKSRQRLHFAQFDPLAESVEIEEVSITARHILKNKAIAVAFQRDPNRIAWIVLEDGSLVGVTFMPKQQVIGWHRHPFVNGLVEDVATVPAGDEASDRVYLTVRRTINGETRRYIEMLADFFTPEDEATPTAEGAWFVHSGLRYAGTPATVISGLDHLEGETVRVLADGAERPEQTVAGGAITLAEAASEVVVGIGMRGYVQSLPIETDAPGGTSKGRRKQANTIILDIVEGAGGTMRSNGSEEEEIAPTGSLDYGAPLPLFTGKHIVQPFGASEDEAIIELICDNALPMTLAGWAPDIDIGEEG